MQLAESVHMNVDEITGEACFSKPCHRVSRSSAMISLSGGQWLALQLRLLLFLLLWPSALASPLYFRKERRETVRI